MAALLLERSKPASQFKAALPPEVRRRLKLKKGRVMNHHIEDCGRACIEPECETDPALSQFLTLLEKDLAQRPEQIKPLEATLVERLRKLTESVQIEMDAPLPPEDQ